MFKASLVSSVTVFLLLISSGHYYVIGECTRPMEVGSCPECHSPIGGELHALVQGNRHAPEFDGAPGPRWSEDEDYQLAVLMQQQEYVWK
jgi:hypothetical protein